VPRSHLSQAVSRAEAEGLAKEYGINYFETSAKKGLGVEEAFRNIAEQVVERLSRDSGPVGAGRAGAGGAAAGAGGGKVDIRGAGDAPKAGGGCCGKS
jgi:hypothetical protein